MILLASDQVQEPLEPEVKLLKFVNLTFFAVGRTIRTFGVIMENANKVRSRVSRKMSTSTSAKSPTSSTGGGGSNNLVSVDFEVFGKVQGVFFRKYTQQKGILLGLRGWCENTPRGTVVGQVEGPREKVVEMKNWLKHEGSPKSRISQCVFQNEQAIPKLTFADFRVRR